MRQRIRRFGVGQTAKTVGVLYALIGLVLAPFLLLAAMFAPQEASWGAGLVIFVPIFYGLLGFVATAIGCVVYNMVAGWVGGIEVEIGDPSAT